jgi:hypothetical protein
MASKSSMAIRTDEACTRIEQRMAELGVVTAPLPRTNRDRDWLRMNQLMRIADMVDALAVDSRLQRAQELIASGNWTKSQIQAILTEAIEVGSDG